jgi:hypothetical protein
MGDPYMEDLLLGMKLRSQKYRLINCVLNLNILRTKELIGAVLRIFLTCPFSPDTRVYQSVGNYFQDTHLLQ